MIDLRDMELLAALARHKHFARAAQECGISQPGFSARISNLEADFGMPIVKRGNRFLDFTEEGKIVLKWARKLMIDVDGMRQEIDVAKGALTGQLSLGTVPTALVYAAEVPAKLRAKHPGLTIRIHSATSSQIVRGLEELSLDAGITYLDNEDLSAFHVEHLYDERYVLLAPENLAPRTTGETSWKEASEIPLCLLTRDMRNRRIVDDVFQSIGTDPKPAMETNAFTAALAQVASGTTATIAPEILVNSLPTSKGTIRLPLVEPLVEKPIGIVTIAQEPVPPALVALAQSLHKPT